LAKPTHVSAQWLGCSWPEEEGGPSFLMAFLLSTVNALTFAALCMCVAAIVESWIFFRKK